jgi:hypothetical protein
MTQEQIGKIGDELENDSSFDMAMDLEPNNDYFIQNMPKQETINTTYKDKKD